VVGIAEINITNFYSQLKKEFEGISKETEVQPTAVNG